MMCNELYDDPRGKGFSISYDDIVKYFPLMIKNEREIYIKCRVDKGDGTLEFKLPSKEIIRAERLENDQIDQLLSKEGTLKQWTWQAFEGTAAKLFDLYPDPDVDDRDNKISIFLVEFFNESDPTAAPSAFDHEKNIWIYAQQSDAELVFKLPSKEIIYIDKLDADAQKIVFDYINSVEDLIFELANVTETCCTLRDYLNVKVKFIKRDAFLFERLTFDNRKEFERGQKYYIHCFTGDLDYDCTQFYAYDGRDFVADNGYRLNYSEILNALKKNAPVFAFRVIFDAQLEEGAPSMLNDILNADLSDAAKDMYDYNYLLLDEGKYSIGDTLEYYPLAVKNERETYIKLWGDAAPEKFFSVALRVSGTRLTALNAGNEIKIFMVKFFNEKDMSAAPSAFDHEKNIWIYAQRSEGELILNLPSKKIFYVDNFDADAQKIVFDYVNSVEDIIVELAKLSEVDCTLREYLGVKVKLIDRNAVLHERMSFYNRKAFERGQKYYIHCSNGYLFYDCNQFYTYDGRDFVADNGALLTYEHIFYVLGSEENPQMSIYKIAVDGREPEFDFDDEPQDSMLNNVIVPREALEKFLRADSDGKLTIFTAAVDDTKSTVSIVRNELDEGRIQIYVEATVEQNGREIMSMPFIHLCAPQHSRYTRAELDDVDAFIEKFERYLNRDDDHGWGIRKMIYELDDFLINCGKFDKFTRIYFEEAAQ